MTRSTYEKTNKEWIHYPGSGSMFSSSKLYFDRSENKSDITRTKPNSYGWRKPTSYQVTFSEQKGPTGRWENRGFGRLRVEEGNLRGRTKSLSFASSAPSVSAGLRSRAEVDALLKLKDQKVNLGQAFAERGQTARLFTDNIGKITRSFRALKRGQLNKAAAALDVTPPRQWPKGLGSRWLELQYGWKPLLSDIYGSCEALSEIPLESYLVTVKSKKREDERSDSLKPWQAGRGYVPVSYSERKMTGCFVRLDYHPTGLLLKEFSSLGLTNPLELAWELMPWSFVVDWAVPIGDWISSLDAAFGYQFVGGSRTEIGRGRWELHSYAAPQKSVSTGIEGFVHRYKMNRTVYLTSPIPTLPRLKNPWSFGHAANAAALMAQAFRR